jgi:hypothetical protein
MSRAQGLFISRRPSCRGPAGYAGIKSAQERPRAPRSDRVLEGGERWFKAPLNLRRPKRTQRLPVFARAHTSNAIEGEAKQRRVGIGGVDDVGR